MDPFEDDGVGGLTGITKQTLLMRELLVFKFFADRKIPIAFTLAGGYVEREKLVELHMMTINIVQALIKEKEDVA